MLIAKGSGTHYGDHSLVHGLYSEYVVGSNRVFVLLSLSHANFQDVSGKESMEKELLRACRDGDADQVRFLISQGAQLDGHEKSY